MHQNIFRCFKRFILPAGFDKHLLRQNPFDRIPCFLRDFLQMSIRVHTNQEAEPNAGTHQRHKTASIFAFFQLDIVRRSRRQRFASADNSTGFIGDFTAADRRLIWSRRRMSRSLLSALPLRLSNLKFSAESVIARRTWLSVPSASPRYTVSHRHNIALCGYQICSLTFA